MLQHFHKMQCLTTLLIYNYRTPQRVASFKQRITAYNRSLDRYDRQFHMRPPSLALKQSLTFPITIPFRLRHRYNPKKADTFTDNSTKMHWQRFTPNEILLAFEHLEYLEYDEMMEGLRYLSEIKGQENHDWNTHPWISKALDRVNNQFKRIKKNGHLPMYYLMKKLKYSNAQFWKKMYSYIEQNIYELYSNQFQKFFLRYYKISDQYFSAEMPDKFRTLLQGRLRSFTPEGIIKIFEIYYEEGRINDFWKDNVFVPLFKSQQYNYNPTQLHKIFRFMLILGHQKDERLYTALYKRLVNFEVLEEEELDLLQEVIGEIKDLFISHRVDPYVAHLKQMRKKMKHLRKGQKKQIPIHELVRQDLIFFLHKKKLKGQSIEHLTANTKIQQKNVQANKGTQKQVSSSSRQ